MDGIKNTQDITSIVMKPVSINKCEIGQDWYKNELEVEFTPHDKYPDYTEVYEFVMREIDGKELNIEDVVDILYKHLLEYSPLYLKVTSHVRGCKTHFDVDVSKSSGIF